MCLGKKAKKKIHAFLLTCDISIPEKNLTLKTTRQTSLVVQWLKICLPMQGTWV